MRKFYYVDTGHRVGLDRFRRAAAILNALDDDEMTLLCSDFRIAHEARHFGIKNSVGIDMVRNIVNIAHKGDKIIFDSAEANPLMLEDMRSYFSTFIRVSDDPDDKRMNNEFLISPYYEDDRTCTSVVVDDKYFGEFEKNIELGFFFGDDDYEKDIEKNLKFFDGLNVAFLSGFYYFLDYEEMLTGRFDSTFEFEEYDTFITSTKILVTSSPQAVLESLASGGKPVYMQRKDYNKDFVKLFETLKIPIINDFNRAEFDTVLSMVSSQKYNKLQQNCNKVVNYLKDKLYL
ncbi:hypothetical protein [Sulfurimonas sp. HSL-1716]|uniref:hypothetical protein n=1 Tax=Hydrocurvibacter sulfurireducens TaxID=3131937 RepID=UPI0031F9A575